eukprot:904991-Prymnesium_polylepis.1
MGQRRSGDEERGLGGGERAGQGVGDGLRAQWCWCWWRRPMGSQGVLVGHFVVRGQWHAKVRCGEAGRLWPAEEIGTNRGRGVGSMRITRPLHSTCARLLPDWRARARRASLPWKAPKHTQTSRKRACVLKHTQTQLSQSAYDASARAVASAPMQPLQCSTHNNHAVFV